MKYDCDTNCPIPKLHINNLPVINLILRFRDMIYNGESISAYGIEKAMVWSDIPREEWWNFSQKIASYFAAMRKSDQKRIKAESEKKSKQGRKHAKK